MTERTQRINRRDFERLEEKIDLILEIFNVLPPDARGVIIDGDRRFLPGTGWDTPSELSPTAQAALAQLESETE